MPLTELIAEVMAKHEVDSDSLLYPLFQTAVLHLCNTVVDIHTQLPSLACLSSELSQFPQVIGKSDSSRYVVPVCTANSGRSVCTAHV